MVTQTCIHEFILDELNNHFQDRKSFLSRGISFAEQAAALLVTGNTAFAWWEAFAWLILCGA